MVKQELGLVKLIIVVLCVILVVQTIALEVGSRREVENVATICSLRDALDDTERQLARCQYDVERRPTRKHLVKQGSF